MPTLPGLRSGRVLIMVEAEERSADALNMLNRNHAVTGGVRIQGAIILIARPTFERPPDRQAAAENRRGSGRSYRRLTTAAASRNIL